jgi:cyclic pyranopterin phosphate synthase
VATTRGRIKAISVSEKKGIQKTNIPKVELKNNFGIIGDAHAGNWHRQVSLLAAESIEKMVAQGAHVGPGDFAENITTQGIDLCNLHLGSKLKLGQSVELELTQFGKKCHNHCAIFHQVGDCIMPREGVFARVTQPGWINVGDIIEISNEQQQQY